MSLQQTYPNFPQRSYSYFQCNNCINLSIMIVYKCILCKEYTCKDCGTEQLTELDLELRRNGIISDCEIMKCKKCK